MCILSGCDYLPSLPGIGLGKAFKFFSRSTDVDINAVNKKEKKLHQLNKEVS